MFRSSTVSELHMDLCSVLSGAGEFMLSLLFTESYSSAEGSLLMDMLNIVNGSDTNASMSFVFPCVDVTTLSPDILPADVSDFFPALVEELFVSLCQLLVNVDLVRLLTIIKYIFACFISQITSGVVQFVAQSSSNEADYYW